MTAEEILDAIAKLNDEGQNEIYCALSYRFRSSVDLSELSIVDLLQEVMHRDFDLDQEFLTDEESGVIAAIITRDINDDTISTNRDSGNYDDDF